MSKEQSGGNNSFYDIPAWVKNADDLNEYLRATGPLSNITKSLFSTLGTRHAGTSPRRDAKKIIHYAVRHLLWIDRPEALNGDISDVDVITELISELPKIKRGELVERLLVSRTVEKTEDEEDHHVN